jgi:hypothetical protein
MREGDGKQALWSCFDFLLIIETTQMYLERVLNSH